MRRKSRQLKCNDHIGPRHWLSLKSRQWTFELLYWVSQCIITTEDGTQTMANSAPRHWESRNPCNLCMTKLGVNMCQIRDRLTTPEMRYIRLHHPSVQFICYDCLQNIFDERHKRRWQEVFHNHVVLADPMIQNRVSQYLWSSIHQHPCLCGDCDPFWLSRGWICWG